MNAEHVLKYARYFKALTAAVTLVAVSTGAYAYTNSKHISHLSQQDLGNGIITEAKLSPELQAKVKSAISLAGALPVMGADGLPASCSQGQVLSYANGKVVCVSLKVGADGKVNLQVAGVPGTNGIGINTSGSAGTNGTSGSSGSDGSAGSSGLNGSAGSNGVSGSLGSSGSNGSTGSTGANGFSGLNGTAGSSGNAGATGTSGSAGSNGASGSAGTGGSTGSAGARGATGSTGATGATGAAGTTGAQGSAGVLSVLYGDGLAGSLAAQVLSLNVVTDPNGGLANSTNGLSLLASCSSTQILKFNGTAWICGNDNVGAVASANLTSGTSGVTVTGGTGAVLGSGTVITIATANGTTTGLLTSADWTTFNTKENALTFSGNGMFSRSGNTVSGTTACSNGQVLKYSGSVWACAADNDTLYSLPNTGTAGTYGSSSSIPVFTTDAQGRITAVTNTTIAGLTTANLAAAAGITNAQLANASVTVTPGTGLSGGGAVALGGGLTLNNTGLLGLTATGPLVATAGQNPALSITQASGSTPGYLSSADYNSFAGKQSSLSFGNLTSSTTGVSVTGGTGAVVGASGATVNIATATGSQTGLLNSVDWTTFNTKENALTFTGNGMFSRTGNDVAANTSCSSGQVLAYNGSVWACTTPSVGVTYTAGTGLLKTGATFSFDPSSLSTVTSVAGTDQLIVYDGTASKKISYNDLFSGVLGSLNYRGTWNASTDTPTLTGGCATGTKGYYYGVSVAGSTNLDGITTWNIGDWVVCNGSVWQRIQTANGVSSVFGRGGAITAASGDYTASQVTNSAAGNVAATTVQGAINELDAEKVSNTLASGLVFVGNGSNVASGVALSGDVTLNNVGVVTIANGAVTSAKIADGTIQFADLASNSCSSGQVIKYNGSAWTCGTDSNTTYTAGTGIGIAGGVVSNSGVLGVSAASTGGNANSPLLVGGTAANPTVGLSDASTAGQYWAWDGSKWALVTPGAGLSIGTIDSQTKSANGAVIASNTLYLQSADATNPGLVTTGTQTLAGDKTLTGNTTATGNITQTGNKTFSTGTGAVSLNGDTTLAANKTLAALAGTGAFDMSAATGTFKTSTGTNTLNGNTVISGSNTFSTGTGAVSLNGDTTIAANKNLTATAGTGSLDYSGSTGAFKTTTGLTTVGGGLTVVGSTLLASTTITNKATGGAIGTAAATVDAATSFLVNQTTAGQTLSLPTPTVATAGRTVVVSNTGSAAFTMSGVSVATGNSAIFVWNGSAWSVSGGAAACDATKQFACNGGNTLAAALSLGTTDANVLNLVTGGSNRFQVANNASTLTGQGATIINTTGTNGITLDSGSTGAVNVATGAAAKTVTVGNTTGATAVNLLAGLGGLTIDGVGGTNYSLGASTTTGTFAVGGSAQTGTANLFTGTGGMAINFGTGAAANTITMGNGTGASAISQLTGSGGYTNTSTAVSSTANVFYANAITTGTAMAVNANALTSGNGVAVNSTATSLTGSLAGVYLTGNNAANTGSLLSLQSTGALSKATGIAVDTSAGSGMAATFAGAVATKKGTDYSTVGVSVDAVFANASLIRLTGASTQTIDSIAGGSDGRILTLVNASAQAAVIRDSSTATTATAANKVKTGTGGDLTLAVDASTQLIYDAGSNFWRVVGGSGGGSTTSVASCTTTATCTTALGGVWNKTVLVDTSAGAVTVTLPTAVSNSGKTITVKKTSNDANSVYVATTASQTIDGSPSATVTAYNSSLQLISNGTNIYSTSDLGAVGSTYGTVSRSTSQAITAANTYQDIVFDTVGANNGVTASASATPFTVSAPGTYEMTFTSGIDENSGAVNTAQVRFLKNGTAFTTSGAAYMTASNDGGSITHTYQFTAVSGDLIKVQGQFTSGTTSTFTGPVMTIKQINGYQPVIGQTVDTLNVRRFGTSQTFTAAVSTPQDIILNNVISGSIPFNTTTGVATLTAGKTYNIRAALQMTGSSPRYMQYAIVDGSTNAVLSPSAEVLTVDNTTSNGGAGILDFTYTPATNQTVKLRTVAGTASTGESIRADLYSGMTITQLGTTASTGVAMNTLTNALANGSLDNSNYTQTWNWNTLAGNNGLVLNSADTSATGNLFAITNASTSASANGLARFQFSGAHTGNGLQLDDATVAGTAMALNANALTSGSGLAITANALVGGNGLNVASSSTGMTGNLVNFTATGATNSGTTLSVGNSSSTSGLALAVTSGGLAIQKGTDYTTTGLSNNAALSNYSNIRLVGASAQTLSGIANGSNGRMLFLTNAGANVATLSNNSGSSSVGNKILTPSGNDLAIAPNGSAQLIYDGTAGSGTWRVIGTTGTQLARARVYVSATSQTLATNAATQITSLNGNANSSTNVSYTVNASVGSNQITISQTGLYTITGAVNISSNATTAAYWSYIYVNGSPVATSVSGSSAAGLNYSTPATITMPLTAGDTIQLWGKVDAGGTVAINAGSSSSYLQAIQNPTYATP